MINGQNVNYANRRRGAILCEKVKRFARVVMQARAVAAVPSRFAIPRLVSASTIELAYCS